MDSLPPCTHTLTSQSAMPHISAASSGAVTSLRPHFQPVESHFHALTYLSSLHPVTSALTGCCVLPLHCAVSAPPLLCPLWHKCGYCPRLHCPDAHVAVDELDAPFINRQRKQQLDDNREVRARQREQRERTAQQRRVEVEEQDGREATAEMTAATCVRPAWLLLDDQRGLQRLADSERTSEQSPRSRLLSLLSCAPRLGVGYLMWKVPLGEDECLSLLRWTLRMNGLHRCSRPDGEDCVLHWSLSCPPALIRRALRHPRCRILHFPHVQQVTHKDWLTYNISSQRDGATNQRLYPHMPAAFALPAQLPHLLQLHRTLGGAVDEQLDIQLHALYNHWTTKARMGRRREGGGDQQQVDDASGMSSRRFHACHSTPQVLPFSADSAGDGDDLHLPLQRSSPIWIVKPAHLGSGRGIVLTDLLHHSDASLKSLVDCIRTGGVAQRYIERPFLLDAHKFDMRLYALLLPRCTPHLPPAVSSDCGERWAGFPFAVFVFEDGLIRFASQPYPPSAASLVASLSEPRVHLTNNSINTAGNGGAASNRSVRHFMHSLRTSADESNRLLAERIEHQIDECILSTLASSTAYLRDGVDVSCSRHFDLLGFDVLLDDRARLWLCEVNSMPDLQCASSAFSPVHPVDFECKRRLLADMFNLLDLSAHTHSHAASMHCHSHTGDDTSECGALPLGGFRRLV